MSKADDFDYNTYLIRVLRRAFLRCPLHSETLNRVKEEFWIEGKTGLLRRVHFKCETCGRKFRREYMAVDHVDPVGSHVDIFTVLKRMFFCGKDNLKAICNYPNKDMAQFGNVKSCHKQKCAKEAAERKALRDSKV